MFQPDDPEVGRTPGEPFEPDGSREGQTEQFGDKKVWLARGTSRRPTIRFASDSGDTTCEPAWTCRQNHWALWCIARAQGAGLSIRAVLRHR